MTQSQLREFEFSPENTDEADVFVTETWVNSYDDVRAALGGDTYDAKEVIKFDWETTHHSFNGSRKEWIVDADSLDELGNRLNDAGFTFDADVSEPEVDSTLIDLTAAVSADDRIEVEYEQKNGNGHNTKVGEVAYEDEDRVVFRRDDGQRMYIMTGDDGNVSLFTSMSHAPFVGNVTSVTVEA